jgi:hypothetical protein
MVVYFALLAAAFVAFPPVVHPGMFAASVLVLSLALTLICWKTGEPPRWRWGRSDG